MTLHNTLPMLEPTRIDAQLWRERGKNARMQNVERSFIHKCASLDPRAADHWLDGWDIMDRSILVADGQARCKRAREAAIKRNMRFRLSRGK